MCNTPGEILGEVANSSELLAGSDMLFWSILEQNRYSKT